MEAQVSGTDIIAVVTQNPGLVLLDAEKFDAFYERMKAETDKLVPDTSTAKGRDEIRSMARRVVTTKTTIDKARLALTKQWREQVDQTNSAGKVIAERLENLAADVRRPLTEWEDAEKARVDQCEAIITNLKAAAVVTEDDTAATVKERGGVVWSIDLNAAQFGDMLPLAQDAKDQAVATLKAAMVRLKKAEDDAAELERLRAAEAERVERERIEREKREAAEAAEREAREAKERAEREAREAEERRIAAQKAEAERMAAAEKVAEDRARRVAEQAAEAERQRIQREHDAALAAERKAREDSERAAQAERDRNAAEKAEAEAEAKRVAAEQAKREANRQHRVKIMGEAKLAIMSCDVSEATAKAIVLAIVGGNVPHTRMEF